jgi:hypothetical protein
MYIKNETKQFTCNHVINKSRMDSIVGDIIDGKSEIMQ